MNNLNQNNIVNCTCYYSNDIIKIKDLFDILSKYPIE